MSISEYTTLQGRTLKVTWDDAPTLPPRELITQVCGLCFTDDSQIVLVAGNDSRWAIPGIPPERNESIEDALVRIARQEGCVSVLRFAYLGAQQIDDPSNPDGLTRYYSVKFWARVQLERFMPRLDIEYRTTVTPSAYLATIKPTMPRITQAILEAACKANDQADITS